MFKVGDEVVLKKDTELDDFSRRRGYEHGRIYVVEHFCANHPGFHAAGVDYNWMICCSKCEFFEPVVRSKTDISIFTEILNNPKAPVTPTKEPINAEVKSAPRERVHQNTLHRQQFHRKNRLISIPSGRRIQTKSHGF